MENWLGLYLFFQVALVIQIFLLAGSQITQGILAVIGAFRERRHGARGWGCANPVVAFLRGLFGLELAYHEWAKQVGKEVGDKGGRGHIQAALSHKMAELIFEAPQVIIGWTIVLVKYVIVKLYNEPLDELNITWNTLSAGLGIISLTFGVMEFNRLHPRSYFADHEVPKHLFLGIFDMGRGTGLRSLVIGTHAFFSLLGKACLYMLVYAYCLGIFTNRYASVLVPPCLIVVFGFLFNLLLLTPMRSWLMIPAAMISMWVNVPWIAAPIDEIKAGTSKRVLLRGCWPAWVAESTYWVLTLIAALFFPVGVAQFRSSPLGFLSQPAVIAIGVVLPIATASISLTLFVGMAAYIVDKRRLALARAEGKGELEEVTEKLLVQSLPHTLMYEWDWDSLSMCLSELSKTNSQV